MAQKSCFKLGLYFLIVLVLLFSIFKIFIGTTGIFFTLEALGTFILLLFFFFGFIGYAKNWGEKALFFFFLFYLANLTLLWYFKGALYLTLIGLALLGLLLSFPKKKCCCCNSSVEEKESNLSEESAHEEESANEVNASSPKEETLKLHSNVKENASDFKKNVSAKKTSPEIIAVETKKTTETKHLEAKHEPGKFVASKRSNVYHEPKCEWAKKISASQRIWFKNKEEAWEKGYKAHKCIN